MSKKTFNVEEFRNSINEVLAGSTCSPDQRKGLILTLESVLHGSGNYRGFRYLTQQEVAVDQLPGIYIDHSGTIEGTPSEKRIDPCRIDSTRVQYF